VSFIGLLDGTSMAAPHVAAVAGLLESYNPSLTALQKRDLIVDNTGPFGAANTKVLGTGILNAQLALAAAPPVVGVPTAPSAPARMLALRAAPNPATSGAELTLRASPGGRVDVAVIDAAGRQVRSLVGVAAADGRLQLRWDGLDASGRRAATGVYMIRATSAHEHAAAKLVVLD